MPAILLVFIPLWITFLAAWFTHIYVCIAVFTVESILLGILGAFVSPVGIIHGVGNWFGFWTIAQLQAISVM